MHQSGRLIALKTNHFSPFSIGTSTPAVRTAMAVVPLRRVHNAATIHRWHFHLHFVKASAGTTMNDSEEPKGRNKELTGEENSKHF